MGRWEEALSNAKILESAVAFLWRLSAFGIHPPARELTRRRSRSRSRRSIYCLTHVRLRTNLVEIAFALWGGSLEMDGLKRYYEVQRLHESFVYGKHKLFNF